MTSGAQMKTYNSVPSLKMVALAIALTVGLPFVIYNFIGTGEPLFSTEPLKKSFESGHPESPDAVDSAAKSVEAAVADPPKAAEKEQEKPLEQNAVNNGAAQQPQSNADDEAVKQLMQSIVSQYDTANCPAIKNPESFITSTCDNSQFESGVKEFAGFSTSYVTFKCRNAVPADRPWIVFLHGARFSYQEWIDTGIMKMTSSLGYNTLAIDLPGYGKSPKATVVDKVGYLRQVGEAFNIEKYVVVSPSMSGEYSVPLLTTFDENMVGYVAVAPVKTDEISDSDMPKINTPTLVLVGEKDTGIGQRAVDHLSKVANSQVYKIPNAGHACYMDDKHTFMREMFKFLMCKVPIQ